MPHDAAEMLTTLMHISFSQLSADDFVKNLALFFRHYMPVSSLNLSIYDQGTLRRIACYGNADFLSSKGSLELDNDLLRRIRMAPHAGSEFEPRIMQGDTGDAYCELFNQLHPQDTTCIYFPLKHLSNLETCVHISICTTGARKYVQEHLDLCEKLSTPLSAAVSVILYRMETGIALGQSADAAALAAARSRPDSAESIETLDHHIAAYIRKIIDYTHGRISGPSGAAMLLGLPASTLWAKMRKLGIYIPTSKKRS